jgi:hypothetical protein
MYPLNFVAATTVLRREGVYGVATSGGLGVGRRQGPQRVLPWDELTEVVAVFAPPLWYYEAVLRSGERVEVDFLDSEGGGRNALAAHAIFVRKEKGVRARRRTTG